MKKLIALFLPAFVLSASAAKIDSTEKLNSNVGTVEGKFVKVDEVEKLLNIAHENIQDGEDYDVAISAIKKAIELIVPNINDNEKNKLLKIKNVLNSGIIETDESGKEGTAKIMVVLYEKTSKIIHEFIKKVDKDLK